MIIRITLVLCAALALSGCADGKEICGKKYESYGLINKDEQYDAAIKYKISPVAVVISVLLVETAVFPVVIVGFGLYEPVAAKEPCK